MTDLTSTNTTMKAHWYGRLWSDTKLYQVVALGPSGITEEHHKIYSKKVFLDEPSARNHIEEFKILCCQRKDDYDLVYLARVDRVKVVELELQL